jgi:2-polyprenyl-6-methoxyphenol hydroxylase-like FAD-dependent oxidoreductase
MGDGSSIDVLVVGAGPTGLTAACELARRGIALRIVDKAAEATTLSKAIGVQARTLEILDGMGIADTLVAEGVRLTGAEMLADGKLVVSASFDELDTRYPFILSVPQSVTERVLTEHLGQLGGTVERGVELVSLAQHDGGVDASLRHTDGHDERVRARFVIGADGAHSTVRKAVGLEFVGRQYADEFWLADVRLDGDISPERVTTFFSSVGLLACFPIPGDRFRLIATCPPGESKQPALADFQRILEQRGKVRARLADAAWLARFHIHCRQVEAYQRGSAFLAGDAAHIHSPVGGQGMNTGIQDAHNLAWKLALVLGGRGRPELLESYQAERHAVGAGVLFSSDVATRVATLKGPVARAVRNRMAEFLSSLEVVQQRIKNTVAELTLTYRQSPIVDEKSSGLLGVRFGPGDASESANLGAWRKFQTAPRAGDRAPDAELHDAGTRARLHLAELYRFTGHTLLLFDGQAPTAEGYARLRDISREVGDRFGGRIQCAIVVPRDRAPEELRDAGRVLLDPEGEAEDRFGANAECLYLVRPDLYIGFRSQPADRDALFAQLAKTFL